jgi:hypothetical protein
MHKNCFRAILNFFFDYQIMVVDAFDCCVEFGFAVVVWFEDGPVFSWDYHNALVSSAKIIGAEVLLIILGKSFVYRRKSRDPKTEPCGTP